MGAKRLSKLFHWFKASRVTHRKWTTPEELVRLGSACAQVNYVSDKFDGELREYYHKFEGRSELFAAVDEKGNAIPGTLIILGDFDINEFGIVG
jgi:hypothetical protein